MPAKDLFHEAVRIGLEKEGWTITDDPFKIEFGKLEMWIDLAAEKMIAAEKGDQKIAVEIKSFAGDSLIYAFHNALGQFLNYHTALESLEPERQLYLAVPLDAYEAFFHHELAQINVKRYGLKLLVYNAATEEVVQWIS